jgi:ABC transport system ATP-binding/permease protein
VGDRRCDLDPDRRRCSCRDHLDHQPTRSAQFVFLLVTAALWLGLIDSCREIVKERSIIVRELAVGVRIDAQLIAKSLVLFTVAALQCLLILTSWSMVGVGLLVSTVARSVDQSTSVIPLLLIPQLLFGGALVAYERMGTVIRVLSDLAVSRWAFAGAGNAIGMNARLGEEPQAASLSGYGTSFFSLEPLVAAVILLGFTATTLLITWVLLAGRSQDV